MKKFLSLLLVSSIFIASVFSEPLKQYQTFSWKKIAKAKKYEINIELQTDDEQWKTEISEQTTDNRIELLLYPGQYRVSISAYNVLGKKATTSDWTHFIILDETEPYLFADSLKKSRNWNSPLLTLNQVGSTTFEEEDEEGVLVAREGDPTNSFFLKGKNIFFPETVFSLVPKQSSETGKPFEAFVDLRQSVPLDIIRRDTENSGVVVAYNPDLLFSGYYDIVAQNPESKSAELELLVIDNRAPVLYEPDFKYSENYQVYKTEITKGSDVTLKISGTGFSNNTIFSFIPDSGFTPYPFESSFERIPIPLTLTKHECVSEDGDIELQLSLPTTNLYTGYYKFTASNENAGEDYFIVLVDAKNPPANNPEIEKVKTKTFKKEEIVEFTVTGANLTDEANYSLIAPYSNTDDSNERVELDFVLSKKGGKIGILHADQSALTPGTYALLVEAPDASDIFYFEMDEHFSFTFADINADEKDSLFYRPVRTIAKKTSTIEDSFTYSAFGASYKRKPKILFSRAYANLGLLNFMTMNNSEHNDVDFNASITVLNFNWLRLNAGFSYMLYENYDIKDYQINAEAILCLPPNSYFEPYAGLSYSIKPNYTYGFTPFAGVRMLEIFDIRYTLRNVNLAQSATFGTEYAGKSFFTDCLSIGISIPLRNTKFVATKTEQTANISFPNLLDGANYEIEKNTVALDLVSEEITGFNDMPNIKKVQLSNTVQKIGTKAFANDTALKDVLFFSGLETIGSKAFENDTEILELSIPSTVRNIEAGAFDGWKSYQTIKLNWSSDDDTPRSLQGVENTNASVKFNDGVYLSKSKAPNDSFFYEDNWIVESTSDYKPTFQRNIIQKSKNAYSPILNISGLMPVIETKVIPVVISTSNRQNKDFIENSFKTYEYNFILGYNTHLEMHFVFSDGTEYTKIYNTPPGLNKNLTVHDSINIKTANGTSKFNENRKIKSITFTITPKVLQYDNMMCIYTLSLISSQLK